MALAVCCGLAPAVAFVSPIGPITARLLGRLALSSPAPAVTMGPDGVFGGASSCSGLYFVSARGSGQPYGKWYENAAGKATDMSVSPQTHAVLTGIEDEFKAKGVNPPIVADQLGPGYKADSVKVITSGLSDMSARQMWDRITQVNVPKYIAGEKDGETELNAYLTQIAYDCYPTGHEPMMVLAGYSQGSMVVHNILNTLAADNATGYMSMIKGAVLIADPERMSFSDVLNLGTAVASDYGVCHLVDDIAPSANKNVCEPPGATADVAKYFSSVATQVCNTGDIVCDTSSVYEKSDGFLRFQAPWTLYNRIKKGMGVHTDSYTDKELISTGRGIALNLLQDGLGTAGASSPDPSTTSPSPDQSSQPPGSSSLSPASTPASPGNGSWTGAETPLPDNASTTDANAGLSSVACPSVSACVAVGGYVDTTGTQQGLLLSGSESQPGEWAPVEAPLPGNADPGFGASVSSVACGSPTLCVAIGSYTATSGDGGLLEMWSGTSWTPVQAPVPANADDQSAPTNLAAVTCPSASQCIVVGSYYVNTTGPAILAPMVLTLGAGDSWTATEVSLPGGAAPYGDNTGLDAVTCTSAASCVAVGTYYDGALLATGAGTSWTTQTIQLPSNAQTQNSEAPLLRSVACSSATLCVAGGSYEIASNDSSMYEGLLVSGSGSSWSSAETPLPANAEADPTGTPATLSSLAAVACQSASCTPVGTYVINELGPGNSLQSAGLVATWDGTSGSAAEEPGVLDAVTCTSASCVVVGDYTDSSANVSLLVLSGSGSSWTAKDATLPANAVAHSGIESELDAVSCPSSTACAAVGYYNDSSGVSHGLVLTGQP